MTDVDALCDRLADGDRRALARLLTLVEDGPADVRRRIVGRLHPRRHGARLIGITGPPGAGKSSVTNAVVATLRAAGRTVAVLAIDPSSPLTGGALLGDRIRMQDHHADGGVFVRSMAARGHLGGLAVATPEAVLVLDAAGFDDVIVETVGVGQSEVDVAAMADTTVVVLAPGLGDGVQAAKAGVLEVASVLVVNKADQPGAGRLEAELRGMLELGHAVAGDGATTPAAERWPPILRTVAVRGEGVAALCDAIEADGAARREDEGAARARARARRWIVELAAGQVRDVLSARGGAARELIDGLTEEVVTGGLDPATAADRLIAGLG